MMPEFRKIEILNSRIAKEHRILFIDVREESELKENHFPLLINLPIKYLDFLFTAYLLELKPGCLKLGLYILVWQQSLPP